MDTAPSQKPVTLNVSDHPNPVKRHTLLIYTATTASISPRYQGIHIRQRHIAGAVCSEGGFVFAADDGEGVEDVFGVVPQQAVGVEVEHVEAGTEVAAQIKGSPS